MNPEAYAQQQELVHRIEALEATVKELKLHLKQEELKSRSQWDYSKRIEGYLGSLESDAEEQQELVHRRLNSLESDAEEQKSHGEYLEKGCVGHTSRLAALESFKTGLIDGIRALSR